MKKPRYTDAFRYTRPYKISVATDITQSFEAERKRLKKPKPRLRPKPHDLSGVFT